MRYGSVQAQVSTGSASSRCQIPRSTPFLPMAHRVRSENVALPPPASIYRPIARTQLMCQNPLRGRRQRPQAFRMCTFGAKRLLAVDPKGSRPLFRRGLELLSAFCVDRIGGRPHLRIVCPKNHFAPLPTYAAPSFCACLQPVVSLGPPEGTTTHHCKALA